MSEVSRNHVRHRRWHCLVAAAAVLSSANVHGEASGGATKSANHHHCVHDEKSRRFEESVDAESLTSPQLLLPLESPAEHQINAFLDVVGAKRHLRSARSLAASASSSSFQPIRIAFDLSKLTSDPGYMCTKEGDIVKVDGASYTCSGSDVLTTEKREFIITVLLKAIQDYFESTLSVQRVVGNLIIKGIGCSSSDEWACCASAVPHSYKTEGVPDADYVLHVTARPTTGSTIAWALPCNIDQFGRPVSGQANFGPGRLDPTTPAARTEQVGTALHEMTHALVFSRGRFYDFRQPLNGAKWGYNNVVSQTQGTGGIWVSKIVTPSVAKQAKQHFNCFDWVNAGIELENGDSGSADFSSHWEKRLLMNEYMTATSSYDPVYSAMTLAMFEDSGWYQVSYANAQILPWGFMEGCGFAQSRCSSWNSQYICSQSSQTSCTSDFTSKGYCNVASYTSSIPAGFQYFQDPKFGGRDSYADYCPFYRAYSNGDCRNIGRLATAVNTDNYMEEVGPSSKCFTSSLSKYSSDTAALRASCYKVLGCTSTGLRLSVGGKEVLCPMGGGTLSVSGYRGKIVCPVANKLCQMLQDKCSGNGVLSAAGVCQCNPGFVGDDCSGISCPTSNNAECGGTTRGSCEYSTGTCKCTSAYTGLSCSELVCPVSDNGKSSDECSGHGTCDRAYGQCKCADGYSGKACECVPGCTATSCGSHGTCDCTTGACTCMTGYSGVDCTVPSTATITELTENSAPITDTIAEKGYKFYKVYLQSSTYDVTFVVKYENDDGDGADVDLYGSFIEQYPTSLSAKSRLFTSDYGIGDRDEINLCGSLGVFPRGLNDTFRFCARPTSSYVLETPGYFYLSVLGYAGGKFTLSIETDKCRNVTCSNHGVCGVNYAGVCSCNRYWSGDDCSVPKCGPDCHDLGTCSGSLRISTRKITEDTDTIGSNDEDGPGTEVVSVNYVAATSGTLQSTSECYGNGVCQVSTDAQGREVPRCVCDDAFTFANPTPSQALCKELLPSVASVQRFTAPFSYFTTTSDQFLKVNAWALFTIQVKDNWEVLVANLGIQSAETDAMLFVRKEKLPSVVLKNQTSSGATFLQFTDSDGWTSGSPTRKVVLTRATSTLSSGLYYIGVFNSAYARASLSYTLSANATDNCTTDDSNGFGICANGGKCNARSSPICTCKRGFVGKYCGLQALRTVLSPTLPSSSSASSSSSSDTTGALTPTPPDAISYVAYRSTDVELLDIGEWAYYSFDIDDTSVRMAQFRLSIYNDMSVATPVLPLLLLRGPSDDGFPTLFTESQQDFLGISQRRATQTVTLAVDKVCSFAATSKDCYKVALFNRKYSGEALQYRLEVDLFRSKATVFPSSTCGATGNKVNCNSNGKCLMVAAAVNDTETASPTCKCNTGWTGVLCNSPKSFDLPQLWSAINNISLLCTTCSSSFSIGRGEVKMFRVPASLRDNSGLRLRVRPVASSDSIASAALTSGSNPNVYVSETLPRSLYDFTHISTANDSNATSSTSTQSSGQVVELANTSFSGQFWVVVFSDYPASDTVEVSSPSRRLASALLHSGRALRVLSEASSASSSAVFKLEAELYELPDDFGTGKLLTEQSFTRAVFDWLFKSPVGIGVCVFTSVFLCLLLGYCLWRLCHAPENQDKTTRQFFGTPTSQPHQPAPRPLVPTAHVRDVELGSRAARSTRRA